MGFRYLRLHYIRYTSDVYYIAKYSFWSIIIFMKNELSDLEYDIMLLLATGMDARAITDYLNINYKIYIKAKNNILKKLKIKTRNQILFTALENELIKL